MHKKTKKTLFAKIFSMLCITAVLFTLLSVGGFVLLRKEVLKIGLREQSSYISAHATTLDNVFENANHLISYLETNPDFSRLAAPNYRESTDYIANEKQIFNSFYTLQQQQKRLLKYFFI